MRSKWMDIKVSLYQTHSDTTGRPVSFRDILLTDFGKDLSTIIALRKLERSAGNYKLQAKPLKSRLQAFTPAALMKTRAKGQTAEISRSGLLQLDFDYDDIKDYDLEELKQSVFSLPFIAFCGLSCSGFGFYALALIAEPDKLNEYAEHCFQVFKSRYGIKLDECKGKKPEDLRYVSYDGNMLIRENPEPLQIMNLKKINEAKLKHGYKSNIFPRAASDGLVNSLLRKVKGVKTGERWATVQKAAYTLGGLSNPLYLRDIYEAIKRNPEFYGEEEKYFNCANVCFNQGSMKPLNK